MSRFSSLSGYITLILATLFWSGNFIFSKFTMVYHQPMVLNLLRWSLVLIVLFPFCYRRLKQHLPVIKENWKILFVLGFCVMNFNSLVYLGLKYTTALNGSLLSSFTPVAIPICAWIFFRERITPYTIIALILAIIGVVVIQVKGSLDILLSLSFNKGDIYLFLSAWVWSIYAVLVKKKSPALEPIVLLFAMVACAFPTIILLSILTIDFSMPLFEVNMLSIVTVVYVAVFASILALFCFNWGVALIGSTQAGLFLYLIPFFISVLSIFFLKEQVYFYHIIGFVFILLSLIIGVYAQKKIPKK